MSTRPIATSTLWQIASQGVMAALSIVTAKFVAIGLSIELAGYYNSAYGFLQIFAILADFGLYAVSVREVSKAHDKEKMLGTFIVLRGIITFASFAAAILCVFVVPTWRGTPFPIGVAIASLVPFFTLLAGMLRTVFQVQYKMHFVFIAEILQRILTTIGIGLFIVYGVRLSTDVRMYEWFLWIGGAGAALLFFVSYFYASRLMRIRPHFEWALFRRILLIAAPFGITYLFITLYRQLDVAFIAFLRPDFALQNAYYGFAGRVEDMAFLMPTLLLNSVLPMLSARMAAKEDVSTLLGKTLLALFILGAIFLAFSYAWARPLTILFATPDYLSTAAHAGTDTAFRLMSVPMFLNGIVLFCFYVCLALHSWRQLVACFGIGVVLSVILNLLWTARFGFVGAAWALILVHVLLTALLVPLTLKKIHVALSSAARIRGLTFSLLIAAFAFASAPLMTSAATIGTGVLLSAVAIALAAYVTGLHREFRSMTA